MLGGPGPGAETVAEHVVGAALAVAATAVAAHPRTASVPCSPRAAVPVILLAVLGSSWWA